MPRLPATVLLGLSLLASCRTVGQTAASARPGSASIGQDLQSAFPTLGEDLRGVYSRPSTWWYLATGFGAAKALDWTGIDENVTDSFARHQIYSGSESDALEGLGEGATLLAGAGGWYLYSRVADDPDSLGHSRILMRTLATTGLSTLALKVLLNERRPNGGNYAFPSGHTSMTVAAATSLWIEEGADVGLPAAVLAGLVALQRLDSSAHDLDDVVAGAALGWTLAQAISARSKPNGETEGPKVAGGTVTPLLTPDALGLTLSWSF